MCYCTSQTAKEKLGCYQGPSSGEENRIETERGFRVLRQELSAVEKHKPGNN